MPTYEYRCRKCGHRFDRFQRITAPPVRSCPRCRSRRVERLISGGGGLIFKGSGFYETDYKRKPVPPKSEGKPDGKGDKKVDSKSGDSSKSTEPKKPDSKDVKSA
jgi:putative FmdB family regulatory protein